VQIAGLALTDTFSLDGNSRLMNAVTVPRDQGVPGLKNYGRRFVTLYRRQGSRPSPRKRNAKR